MGMSASQARLIALTARMSDTEYEAQQVNQQRLTLSNQMNAIYEQLCNMDVPTPPSKLDPKFMKPVFKGQQGGTEYKASFNSSGTITLQYKVNGDVVSNAGSKELTEYIDPSNYVDQNTKYSKTDFKRYDVNDYYEIVNEGGEEVLKPATNFKEGTKYKNKTSGDEIDGKTALDKNLAVAELLSFKYVVQNPVDNTFDLIDPETIKDGDLRSIFKCSEPEKFANARTAQIVGAGTNQKSLVGGCPTMLIDQARERYSSDSAFSCALSGLQNTFEDTWEKFSVIVSTDSDGKHSFTFCLTSALQQSEYTDAETDKKVQVYDYSKGSYWKTESDNIDPKTAKFDTNGNLYELNGITFSFEQEVNEYLYEEAVNEYNADKAIYDHEQNILNKQSSVYQRQDKMLEMKLTRLDNERNALNTELEAVKKVIQDSIDRGFKTFSG